MYESIIISVFELVKIFIYVCLYSSAGWNLKRRLKYSPYIWNGSNILNISNHSRNSHIASCIPLLFDYLIRYYYLSQTYLCASYAFMRNNLCFYLVCILSLESWYFFLDEILFQTQSKVKYRYRLSWLIVYSWIYIMFIFIFRIYLFFFIVIR